MNAASAEAPAIPRGAAFDSDPAYRRRVWLAIAAGTLGGFMALLDTSIVNSSLPVIQGEIGATRSEATWVGTAYLLAEIIILPLTAWIERMLGMRRFLLFSAILFTLFSILCGSAANLTTIIIGRLGQGLSGGMMIPSAYSLAGRLLPADQQSRAVAIISVPILVAPIVGPLLGGWLTEHFSWHYAFFINVPISAVLILLLLTSLEASPMDLREIAGADWLGITGVTTFLGCMTVLLEEGHNEQWFESAMIWKLAAGAGVGLVLLALGQVRPGRPVIKLSLLRNRVLAAVMVLIFACGVIMYCNMFLVPQFLVTLRDYNAFQAGQVAFASGASSCAVMFVYPAIMKHGNLKAVAGLSMLTLGFGCSLVMNLTADAGAGQFLLMQTVWGAAIALVAIPLQQIAITMVDPADIPEVTSLVTISRNLGGSVGLAALASFEEARLDFHHWRLAETLGANDPQVGEAVSGWAGAFGGGAEGLAAAMRAIDGRIMVDALVMTFNDAFLVLAVMAAIVAPMGLFLPSRLPDGPQGAPMH